VPLAMKKNKAFNLFGTGWFYAQAIEFSRNLSRIRSSNLGDFFVALFSEKPDCA
jgi:hypothetical protein